MNEEGFLKKENKESLVKKFNEIAIDAHIAAYEKLTRDRNHRSRILLLRTL